MKVLFWHKRSLHSTIDENIILYRQAFSWNMYYLAFKRFFPNVHCESVTSENSRPQKQTWAGGLHFFKAPPLGTRTVFPRLVGCWGVVVELTKMLYNIDGNNI